jgi:peroxiredoxin Q/BCP
MKRRSLLQTAFLGTGIFLLAPARVLALGGTSPEIGIKAPDFDLQGFSSVNPDQKHWSLTSLKGSWLVVYFYPRDFTSGCTIEAHGFQEALPDFKKQGAEVLAISADSVSDHESFCSSEELMFPLLSDPDGVVSKAYGSWMAPYSMRHTFIIDPESVLQAVWTGVRPVGHASEVLSRLNDLQTG